jgi:hypothetical protein
MIKDFIGQDVVVGDYFAYPLIVGRSASMALYQLVSIGEAGKVKARKLNESYGFNNSWRYLTWTQLPTGEWDHVQMTDKQRAKVDAKTSTLNMFHERAILLKDYKESK